MAILTRFIRLWKADMHGVMDQMEDKALLLKQYLREMESSLQQKHVHLNQLNRTCEQIDNDLAARDADLKKVETDIELAVRKEKDDIARKLIRRRLALQADVERLQTQRHQLQEEQKRLAETVSEQQLKYEQLKLKAAVYCERSRMQAKDMDAAPWAGASSSPVTEDEVELELLRCKEAFAQGGDV